VHTLPPNFTIVALKMSLTGAKIAKIVNFGTNFPQGGISP